MYCTTCGKELNEGAVICHHCGFRVGVENKHCSHCGVEVRSGQSLCINCGFMLTPEKPTNIHQNEIKNQRHEDNKLLYKKYEGQVKRTKILALTMHILAILLVVSLIFLPIYTYAYTPQNLSDFGHVDNLEELEDLIKKGTIDKEFSLWDDFKIVTADLFKEDNDSMYVLLSLVVGMFAIFEVIFAAIFLGTTAVQLIKSLNGLVDLDKTTLLVFTEIRKTGSISKKEKFFKKQTAITMVLYAVFDVIFSKMDASLLEAMPSDIRPEMTRHMISFTGVAPMIFVVIILLVGYLIVNAVKKKSEENLAIAIAKEDD